VRRIHASLQPGAAAQARGNMASKGRCPKAPEAGRSPGGIAAQAFRSWRPQHPSPAEFVSPSHSGTPWHVGCWRWPWSCQLWLEEAGSPETHWRGLLPRGCSQQGCWSSGGLREPLLSQSPRQHSRTGTKMPGSGAVLRLMGIPGHWKAPWADLLRDLQFHCNSGFSHCTFSTSAC